MLASAPDDGQAYRWTVLVFDECRARGSRLYVRGRVHRVVHFEALASSKRAPAGLSESDGSEIATINGAVLRARETPHVVIATERLLLRPRCGWRTSTSSWRSTTTPRSRASSDGSSGGRPRSVCA
jgi:hypothetical protein